MIRRRRTIGSDATASTAWLISSRCPTTSSARKSRPEAFLRLDSFLQEPATTSSSTYTGAATAVDRRARTQSWWRRLARAAAMSAVLPEYRLAPEHRFPAALDDAVASYRAVLGELDGDSSRLVVGGDSAGGGLAVAMCVALRDAGEPLPRALALLSPWVDLTCSSPSWDARFEGDPVLDHSLRDGRPALSRRRRPPRPARVAPFCRPPGSSADAGSGRHARDSL